MISNGNPCSKVSANPVLLHGRTAFSLRLFREKKGNIAPFFGYHLSDGATLWTHRHAASTRGKISDYNSRVAPTPVVDDQRVYAFFEEGDLMVLNHDGNIFWERDLRKEYGPFEGNHGLGASPALASTGLILTLDHGGQSWLICLDKQTGNLNWKTLGNHPMLGPLLLLFGQIQVNKSSSAPPGL